jgi:5'-nucleotidase
MLPPGLVSNLQQVLLSRKGGGGEEEEKKEIDPSNDGNDKSAEPSTSTCVENTEEDSNNSKPIVLVTNGDGIDSPGLVSLVEALVREGLYNVHVCAPQSWVFFSFPPLFSCFCLISALFSYKGCLQFLSSEMEDVVMGFELVLRIWEDGFSSSLFSFLLCFFSIDFHIWACGFCLLCSFFNIYVLFGLIYLPRVCWFSLVFSYFMNFSSVFKLCFMW